MNFKYFKITTACILCAVYITASDIAGAQVFSPRANTGSQAKVISAPKSAEQKPVTTENSAVLNQEADKTDVKKNFSGDEQEEKYDNRTPKIISFKIVNGEVVLDETKDRSILVYYDNYQVFRGLDDYVRCSLRVYVLNDLTEKISNLSFKLHWPDISTSIQMSQLNPGVRTYKDITLIGDGCFALDKAPTIEVNRCRVKTMSQDTCADAIKWYEKPQS